MGKSFATSAAWVVRSIRICAVYWTLRLRAADQVEKWPEACSRDGGKCRPVNVRLAGAAPGRSVAIRCAVLAPASGPEL